MHKLICSEFSLSLLINGKTKHGSDFINFKRYIFQTEIICITITKTKEIDLSVPTVIRVFDYVNYPKAELPKILSIDEFKGNTDGEKYQCILTDPVNKVVLDILPERYKPYLTNYFKQYPQENRNEVEYFVSDMWQTYADISDIWFKNATQIIDKYHWILNINSPT